jgi:glycosyltransferase involved in cell wall biosynthesis
MPVYRFEIRKGRMPLAGILLYLWCLVRILKRINSGEKKIDLIHAHVWSAGFYAIILGIMFRIPVIITEHSSSFYQNELRRIERLMAGFAIRQAAIVLPVSNALKKSLECFKRRGSFIVVPNTVDTSLFARVPPVKRHAGQKKEILTVAMLNDNKGYSILFNALQVLKEKRNDFAMNIIGDGPKREEYLNTIKKYEMVDYIKLYGQLPRYAVARYMAECDFFVLPSFYETFGVVLVEALSCGKPVVASNSGGPSEFVTEENGILVQPGDALMLSKAIDYMLDNYHLYDYERISASALEKYSYESVGRKLDAVYSEVLKRKAR